MAFGFNSFSETPYAAIVENPIVESRVEGRIRKN